MTFILPETCSGFVPYDYVAPSGAARIFGVSGLIVHPGDHGGGVTPVPIPNTAVKPSSADGTVRETWWESRTLPGFTFVSPERECPCRGSFFVC